MTPVMPFAYDHAEAIAQIRAQDAAWSKLGSGLYAFLSEAFPATSVASRSALCTALVELMQTGSDRQIASLEKQSASAHKPPPLIDQLAELVKNRDTLNEQLEYQEAISDLPESGQLFIEASVITPHRSQIEYVESRISEIQKSLEQGDQQ